MGLSVFSAVLQSKRLQKWWKKKKQHRTSKTRARTEKQSGEWPQHRLPCKWPTPHGCPESGLRRGLPATHSVSSLPNFSGRGWRSGEIPSEAGEAGKCGGLKKEAPLPMGPAGHRGLQDRCRLLFLQLPLLLPGGLSWWDGGTGSTSLLRTPPSPQGCQGEGLGARVSPVPGAPTGTANKDHARGLLDLLHIFK
ncbi:uncharacterized protein LOC134514842 isoform X2 [Chroicocephalus ridibundus]|uniref:uncharacterized protein LOC134514842 isoform X2 n=1 Tax=Chroicocephalus ridibundus TaxID=1192867 RepID=UPI002FDC9105